MKITEDTWKIMYEQYRVQQILRAKKDMKQAIEQKRNRKKMYKKGEVLIQP